MAVVVITQGIRSHVSGEITKLHSDKIAEARKVPSHWGDMIYNKMFSLELREKMEALPAGYLGTLETFNVRPLNRREVTSPYGFTAKLSQQRRVPNVADSTIHGMANTGSTNTLQHWVNLSLDDPRWDNFVTAEYAPWCQAIRDLEFARDNDVKNAMAVLNAFRTLAPALKEWPALWELLPEETKSRHKEVVERKSGAARVVPTVDLDTLTGRLAAKRMGVK